MHEIIQLFDLLLNWCSGLTLWLSLSFCKVGIGIILPISEGCCEDQCKQRTEVLGPEFGTRPAQNTFGVILHFVGFITTCSLIKHLLKVYFLQWFLTFLQHFGSF